MHAAWSGREDLVDELLAHGADVFVRNADGNTALWLACVGNCHAVVRKLVAAGAELNHQNDVGATVLMYAASSGKPELVKELLTLGADPYRTNQDGIKAGEMAATARCLAHLRHTLH
jgi:ankyrin repeat protein